MEPLVCVILVNYNRYEDTKECVRSLLMAEYNNIRICIVDNASFDGLVQYDDVITAEKCDIIFLDENVGFSSGNNIGIAYTKKYNPSYYLILNNDTVVTKDFLKPLVDICEQNEKIGIATGKILYYDEPTILWFGGSYYDKKLGEYRICGMGIPDGKKYNIPGEIYYTTGCFMLIPLCVMETVGKMSEEYFLYYEDADYCERIKQHGYSIYYLPKSVIFHKESRSTKKGSNLYLYYVNRNYLFFVKKYAKKDKIKLILIRLYLIIRGVIRGRIEASIAYKICRDFFINKQGKESDL